MKKVLIYLSEGFSDWEIAYITPSIAKNKDCELIYLSDDGNPVRSMGGMLVVADKALADVDVNDAEMLILPGGTLWEQAGDKAIEPLIWAMHGSGKKVAAICGATIYLATLGLLDHVKHTSSNLGYLMCMVPQYKGESLYLDKPAVTDGGIITAGGVWPVDFAREVFSALQLMTESNIDKWYQLYKNGIWSE